jgi:polar amino acid transport system substrate-binding protein
MTVRRMLLVGCVALLFLGTLAGVSTARTLDQILSSGVVRVGFYPQDPPKQYYDPDTGEAIGLEVDIAKEFASALGVRLELVDSEWDGLIPGLLTEKWDIIIANMARLTSRAVSVSFTLAYENIDGMVALVRTDDTRFAAMADLNQPGVRIGVNRGSAGNACAESNCPLADIQPFQSAQVAAMALQAGQLDAVVEDLTTMELYANEHSDVRVIGAESPSCPVYTAFAIKPGNFDLWNFADTFLFNLKKSGTYSTLYAKWFPTRPDPGANVYGD